jgi:hypothetical protein
MDGSITIKIGQPVDLRRRDEGRFAILAGLDAR